MPLPGGPSDKIGNRYELRWIVRRLVDLVTGRLEWLRIEPPGEDAIEFRCGVKHGEFAYQIKRGVSGGGHWTVSALADVLDGFGILLAADPELQCIFGSAHAAPELQELTERARASRGATEFSKRFLGSKWLASAWAELRRRWRTNNAETWRRLRHISVASISEHDLQENTDTILQLLFDTPLGTARAVLTDFALDSIHAVVRVDDVLKYLAAKSIRRTSTSGAKSIAPSFSPPPATGVRRDVELERIAHLIAHGQTTIFIGGISGIGKTTVASQFAAGWGAPVCWLDCALLSTGVEALATIGEFLANLSADDSLTKAMPKAEAQVGAVARLAGKVLSAHGCLVVWDGVDGDRQAKLRPVIDEVATTILSGGAQLVTAQESRDPGKMATNARVHIDRLDKRAVSQILANAFPDARVTDIEVAEDITGGHPYLVQLLVDAAQVVDLGTALRSMRSEARGEALISELMAHLPEASRKILASLAWLDIPFGSVHVERLGGVTSTLKDLATRHLIIRSSRETYRVHELVAHLIRTTTTDNDRIEFHERAALLLRSIENPAWLEVRAMLRHARAASISDVAREAGTLLLRYAMEQGLWGLVREAAEGLTQDSIDYYSHFVLGKCYRMSFDLEKALTHYKTAETLASEPHEREIARYNRASVLCDLGRRPEADILFSEMLDSSRASIRSEARVALALGASKRGEVDAAMLLLDEALAIATEAGVPRELSQIHLAIANVLIDDAQWENARNHIKEAQSIRSEIRGSEEVDVFAWFHLYQSALEVERALGDHAGTRNAAHGLWRFAVASGSIPWETKAARLMCLADRNENDSEVVAALARLHAMNNDANLDGYSRVFVLEALVVCEWSLRHYEAAIEAILELLALSAERKLNIPIFAHLSTDTEPDENVMTMPSTDGPPAYALLAPPGEAPEFVGAITSRVLERRPELVQYPRLVIGEKRASAKPTMKKPKNKRKKANKRARRK